MNMFVRLEGEDKFVKNVTNNSLVNVDIPGLKEYKNKKEAAAKMNVVLDDINNMKIEMSEIKNLLQQLVNQNSSK
jgi:hypothetical protein